MLLRRLFISRRHCAPRASLWRTACRFSSGDETSSTAKEASCSSAVNVEDFTLNEEVVKRDMEALRRWNDLSSKIDTHRAGKEYDELLAAVDTGLLMFKEMGPLNAPIQCETLLLLEAAQAHYNLQQYEAALAKAHGARDTLMAAPEGVRDLARLGEVNQLIGYIHLRSNKPKEAVSIFTDVLRWIDVDSRTASPMQAVSAVNMRRFIVTGIGLCYHQIAQEECASGGDGREMYGRALDLLVEALNVHIDENDHEYVKLTLLGIMKCFDGVGDGSQAITTAEKLVRWCTRRCDEEGIVNGNEWYVKMKEKYAVV